MILTGVSGDSAIDSALEARIQSAQNDRERSDILNSEAWRIRYAQPAESLSLAQRAKQYANSVDYREGIAESLSASGIAHYNLSHYEEALTDTTEALSVYTGIGNKAKEAGTSMVLAGILFRLSRFDRALEYLSTALLIKEEQDDKQGIASVLSNISNTYQAIGQFDIALEHLLKALELQEEIVDAHGIAITANNIGGIYFKLGHTDTALKYLHQALSWFRDGENLFDTSKTLCNIGHMYGQMGNYDRALEYQAEALSIAKMLDDQQNIAATITSMGRIYAAQTEMATALSFFATSLKIMRAIGDKQGELEALRYVGDIYNHKKEHKRALRYYKQGIDLAGEIGAMNDEATLYECASGALESLKEFELSLEYFKRASAIRNDILTNDKQKLIAVMEIRFNIERAARDREIFRLRNVELADAIKALQEKSDALSSAYHDIEQQQRITAEMNRNLENANRQLNELNLEKNELLGIVTHDVKNLVAGIKLAAEGVRRHKLVKEEQVLQMTSERILRASNDITHLITSLLDANALETGKITFREEETDVTKIMQSLVEYYRPQLEQKQLNVEVTYSGKVSALCDPDRLREALDNIFSNAVKYSPKGKNIRVLSARRGELVRILIADEGQGFTEEDKKHTFQKFQKLSAKPTGGESSTGLGLSIAKKLIERMDGTITLESEAGKGATFIIEIPSA